MAHKVSHEPAQWPYSLPDGSIIEFWGRWYVVVENKLRGGFEQPWQLEEWMVGKLEVK